MQANTHCSSLVGVDAQPVRVEVRANGGLPGLEIVGLPERAVRESRFRVQAALETCGIERPKRMLVINLAPGDLRKTGAGFDLAIAVAVAAAAGRVDASALAHTLLLGELSLEGEIRPVRGTLSHLSAARQEGHTGAVIPRANCTEGALATGLDVRCASHLREVLAWLKGEKTLALAAPDARGEVRSPNLEDLADVRGQEGAKRALEIAAAGGHHVLLVGPPGAGKTMLARRMRGLLPLPAPDEALEIATISGAAGQSLPGRLEAIARPFRAPHHSASRAALVGGGDPVQPGEVTLAHRGVLFLDELPEFRRDVVESLRTTMETGRAVIARARCRVSMPADPLVVAAMNPCPCGYTGDRQRVCTCAPDRIERYRARVSGPVVDRFDLHIALPRVPAGKLRRACPGDDTATVRDRVVAARTQIRSETAPRNVEQLATRARAEAVRQLERALDKLGLSARAYAKVLRVAHTIAHLEGRECIDTPHIAEAIQYRVLDRRPGEPARPPHASLR